MAARDSSDRQVRKADLPTPGPRIAPLMVVLVGANNLRDSTTDSL
mgnify:FL=1